MICLEHMKTRMFCRREYNVNKHTVGLFEDMCTVTFFLAFMCFELSDLALMVII